MNVHDWHFCGTNKAGKCNYVGQKLNLAFAAAGESGKVTLEYLSKNNTLEVVEINNANISVPSM